MEKTKHTPGPPVIPSPLNALRAIVARIGGEYDNPILINWGPLDTDLRIDIVRIARAAIAKAENDVTKYNSNITTHNKRRHKL